MPEQEPQSQLVLLSHHQQDGPPLTEPHSSHRYPHLQDLQEQQASSTIPTRTF